MIFLDVDEMGWQPFVASWLQQRQSIFTMNGFVSSLPPKTLFFLLAVVSICQTAGTLVAARDAFYPSFVFRHLFTLNGVSLLDKSTRFIRNEGTRSAWYTLLQMPIDTVSIPRVNGCLVPHLSKQVRG